MSQNEKDKKIGQPEDVPENASDSSDKAVTPAQEGTAGSAAKDSVTEKTSVAGNRKSKDQREKRRRILYRMTITAVFLATALVTKTFTAFNLPIFGAGGMRVGLTGVFTSFPALLFGPVYGAIVSGLSDLLGYIVKPDGAYIPWLTLTAAAGGFIKGFIWKYAVSKVKSGRIVKLAAAMLVIVFAGLGVAFHTALISDGVQNGLVAVQSELPSKGAIENLELSPLSNAAVSLAQYNKDTITLSAVNTDAEEVTLPSFADIDGHVSNITKIGADIFAGNTATVRVYIGSTYTSVDKTAFAALFADGRNVEIIVTAGSKTADALADAGILHTALEEMEFASSVGSAGTVVTDIDTLSDGTYTIKSSDTFRKYLAGYANFLTLGLESVSVAALIVFLVDMVIELKNKNDSKRKSLHFLKIFAAVGISGLIVTTVNTEILRNLLAAWNGRSFMILLIPRIIEEAIVCMLQSYVISVLYGIYVLKIRDKIPALREKNK